MHYTRAGPCSRPHKSTILTNAVSCLRLLPHIVLCSGFKPFGIGTTLPNIFKNFKLLFHRFCKNFDHETMRDLRHLPLVPSPTPVTITTIHSTVVMTLDFFSAYKTHSFSRNGSVPQYNTAPCLFHRTIYYRSTSSFKKAT